MKKLITAVALCSVLPPGARAELKEDRRLDTSREVLTETMHIKEGIPPDLLHKAECVAVIPGVKKAALGVGGRFGYGAMACRTDDGRGPWSRPLMISLKGGSIGFQIGGQESDLVLLFMNPKAITYILRNKFTLGADASIAAGPIGRTAEAATDAQMRAEILSYSRSRGLFAGLSLEGAALKQDESANRRLYRRTIDPRDVLASPDGIPPGGAGFVQVLEDYSPPEKRR